MDLRLAVGSLLFLVATAIAQEATPVQPKPQDPDKPQQSVQDQINELTKEKQRLLREIQYAEARATNAKALLREKCVPSKLTYRSIDAGVLAPPPTVAPSKVLPIPARVGTQDELAAFGPEVMVLVNGSPIHKSQFDTVMNYLRTLPNSGDDTQRAQRVLMEMIRTEVACSAFADSDARAKAIEVRQQLAAGKPVAELAKAHAVIPGAAPEGRIEVTRNSVLGAVIEQAAFATKVGERAEPIRTALGMVVLQVASFEKGTANELDKVQVDAILVPFTDDQVSLDKVLDSAMNGQVQLLVRDESTLNQLPAIFRARPAAATAKPRPVELDTLRRTLKELGDEMANLQRATDEGSKARLKELTMQYEKTKQALKNLSERGSDAGGVEIKKDAPKDQKD